MELDISGLERKQYTFTWEGNDYILREASVEAARAYRVGIAKCLKDKENAEGKVSGITYAGGDPFAVQNELVKCCTFKKGEDRHVNQETFATFTDRLNQLLFEKVQEMSDLASINPKARKEQVKNSPEATQASSA